MQWKTIHCMLKYRNEFDGNICDARNSSETYLL